MKKSTFMIGVASLALLAFVSCKKNENKLVSFQGTTSEFVVEEEDRAYLDGNNAFTFEQGDIVKMFNLNSEDYSKSKCADYAARYAGRTVLFESVEDMPLESMNGNFYSFFPGENVSPDLSNFNRATFTLSEVQDYYEVNGRPSFSKKDMYCAAKVEAANIHDASFNFKNICGILRLKYYDEGGWTIKSIRVEDKHFQLSGNVSLKVDQVTEGNLVALCEAYNPANPEATISQVNYYKNLFGYSVVGATDNKVTLDFGEGGYTLSTDATNPSVFYIVLRPLALAHGYRVIVTDMNDNEYVVVDSNTNKKIKPNVINANSAKSLKPYHTNN